VLGYTIQQSTERPAKRQIAGTGNDAADKAHRTYSKRVRPMLLFSHQYRKTI
jgi:hypothetical protein